MSQSTYVEVTFREAGELFLFDAADFTLSTNDSVIVETEHGPALGTVKRVKEEAQEAPASFELYKVLRIATSDDLRRASRHQHKEREAYEYCRQKIEDLQLPMKLIRAEYFFNGSKLLFYFSAEGRVDFRTLVRDLARYFQKRIEMRQIGVRDSAKLIGGVGVCGQELCCSRFLRQFHPVSIRMVKDQGLPLNQQKVSGVCGRLMCCLAYEQGLYKEMRKRLPKIGQDVQTDKGIGKVRDVYPVQEKVRLVFFDEDPPVEEEMYLKDLHEFRDIPLPEAEPVQFDNKQKGKRRKRRGLEPLMEPRRGHGHDNDSRDRRRGKPERNNNADRPGRKKNKRPHKGRNEEQQQHTQAEANQQAQHQDTQHNEAAVTPAQTEAVAAEVTTQQTEAAVAQNDTVAAPVQTTEPIAVVEAQEAPTSEASEPNEPSLQAPESTSEAQESNQPPVEGEPQLAAAPEENKGEEKRRRNRRRRRNKRNKGKQGENANNSNQDSQSQASQTPQNNSDGGGEGGEGGGGGEGKPKRRRRRRKRRKKPQGGNGGSGGGSE